MSANESSALDHHIALYKEADSLYRAGHLKRARALFMKALLAAPGDVDTLWAIGSCFSELGRPRLAERYFRRARTNATFAERGELLYNIANTLFDQRRFHLALRLYTRVPRCTQAFAMARRNAVRCQRRLRANPSLHPTRYGWLRQPPRAGELKR